jgi:hypothetical protein
MMSESLPRAPSLFRLFGGGNGYLQETWGIISDPVQYKDQPPSLGPQSIVQPLCSVRWIINDY